MQLLVNGTQREVTDGLTVGELLRELDVTIPHVAVELNPTLYNYDRQSIRTNPKTTFHQSWKMKHTVCCVPCHLVWQERK